MFTDLKQLRAIFEESVEAATRAQNDRLLALVRVLFADCVMNGGGSCDEAADLATAAIQDARRSGDPELAAEVQAVAGYPYLHTLRLREMLDATETALELTDNRPDLTGLIVESPRGFAFEWRWLALAVVGRSSEALVVMNQGFEFLRCSGLKQTLSWAGLFRVLTLQAVGAAMSEAE